MENGPQSNAQLATLATALNELRDTWQLLAMILQDQLTDSPSEARDAVMAETKRALERFRRAELGNTD